MRSVTEYKALYYFLYQSAHPEFGRRMLHHAQPAMISTCSWKKEQLLKNEARWAVLLHEPGAARFESTQDVNNWTSLAMIVEAISLLPANIGQKMITFGKRTSWIERFWVLDD